MKKIFDNNMSRINFLFYEEKLIYVGPFSRYIIFILKKKSFFTLLKFLKKLGQTVPDLQESNSN